MAANAPQKYGLLLRGKHAAAQPASASSASKLPPTTTRFALGKKLAKPAAFEDDDDDNDDQQNNDQEITSFSSSSSSAAKSASAAAASRAAEQKRVNLELRAVQAQRSKLAEEDHRRALEEDPNVFDYDAVYDGLKQAELDKKKSKDNPDGGVIKKPRYMAALIKASAQRKIDLERAELRKVQREREEEGEEFGDKEKFVTGAYKQQMAELKRVEEEEKRREAMEGDVTKGGNLTAFYRDILNQSDPVLTVPTAAAEHEGVGDRPSSLPSANVSANADTTDDERVKQDAIKQGLVQVNDSQEVVDKRQLLSGGLNLTSRTVVRQQREREEREREAREKAEKKAAEERARVAERKALREQQMRAREMVMRQHAEKEEEKKRKKEAEQEELRIKMARQTTDETVSDARARYLARKKAQPRVEEDSDSD
ncbi:hypothetical protein HDU87_000039 [Geranomyces variabilis]|uniref:Nuclear speckle splicing regulatory protein 1 N-terminal domain-containing protein n=1 Tax=Geranomyces variabilis TaxID=109894 RepID=A0AAD5TWJ1_9FUNG|nr:hypothetical protein HDU87_000039 [Geranomyces variabilis]